MNDEALKADEKLREQALTGGAPDEGTARLAEQIINDTSDEEPSTLVDAGQEQAQAGGEGDDPTVAKVRKEAASYRRKLREAEAERDKLRSSVETMQRHEAERLASADRVGALSDGADLWRGGVELSELIGDEGVIDAEKVQAARDRVIADHPHWRRHHQPGAFDEGARQSVPAPGPDFASKLRDAAGG